MNRADTLSTLRAHAGDLRRQGVAALYLFGSLARDEARPDSDVDLFIDVDPEARFSLIELVDVREYLADVLGRRVDVFPRDGLRRVIRGDVEASALKVF
jgi:uncharacterized protein